MKFIISRTSGREGRVPCPQARPEQIASPTTGETLSLFTVEISNWSEFIEFAKAQDSSLIIEVENNQYYGLPTIEIYDDSREDK